MIIKIEKFIENIVFPSDASNKCPARKFSVLTQGRTDLKIVVLYLFFPSLGHLFAIAAQKSVNLGYDGYMYGFAADKKLLKHYVNTFHGEVIAILHPYQFASPQIKLDLRGLMQYAKEKGVKVIELTEKEKAEFIRE